LVKHTDEDLLAMVEADVDKRIEQYEEAKRNNPSGAYCVSLAGSLVFGGADHHREEQIACGMDYYRSERQHQREIHAAIEKLRSSQRK
jgi:hypothetical protein